MVHSNAAFPKQYYPHSVRQIIGNFAALVGHFRYKTRGKCRYIKGMAARSVTRFILCTLGIFIGPSLARSAEISPNLDLLKTSGRRIEYTTRRPEGTLTFIHNGGVKVSLLARSAPPVSVRSVVAQVKTFKGKPDSLVTFPTKQGTLFGFSDNTGQLHFFSTRGGYLSVSGPNSNAANPVKEWIAQLQIDQGGSR